MENFYLVCTSDFCYKNKIFNLDSYANRDNYYYPYYIFKKKMYESNILLNTYDYIDKTKDDNHGLIFFDIPNNMDKYIHNHPKAKKYLVIWESKVVHPINWEMTIHAHFDKIFTWSDEIIDDQKYFKINFSSKLPEHLNFELNKKNRLCAMIIGHKFASHPLELYTERVKTIRWFEQKHPDDFDLYGIGWDSYCFKGVLSPLNRFRLLTKLLKPNYPSYKGTVKSKKETYEKYKFAICYENARDIPGYITEKIFDCFFAGCVPVYWGAPNVTEHIPADTFIDRRDFRTHEELYEYIKMMPDDEYEDYLNAIKRFIRCDRIYPFSAEYFAETIVDEIVEDMKK